MSDTQLKERNQSGRDAHKGQAMIGLDEEKKTILAKIANTIRQLSIEAVQKADSGHPGLPLGCADIGAYLYGYLLRHNPKNPYWVNRDRFVLSAGHGSMLLYSCLHLAGFDLSLDEIKRFRQLHSKTPGHPEMEMTPGVESTTGPLGQGLAAAAGQALGLKMLGAKFNTAKHHLFDAKVYVLAGDGCIMEGITSEASSLAGHLKLDNLVVIYDANNVCLDGPLSESCSEDTRKRYEAYGWQVYSIDGNSFDEIHEVFTKIRNHQDKPVLIHAHTIIGKGSPNKSGTYKVHGSPLGSEEVAATKRALGLPEEEFYIGQSVRNYFAQKMKQDEDTENRWKQIFSAWSSTNSELYREFEWMSHRRLPDDLEQQLKKLEIKSPVAGRKASNTCLQLLGKVLPQLYGGSADLSCSDLTQMGQFGIVSPGMFNGRNIKFGVREFAMAAMAAGLAETQMITPYIGTFLTFSDYMRNAIRLSALMKLQVIYVFTHDSIFLGEDGPTHQPIEHYAALRAIPNVHFIRPGDANEVKMAWLAALKYNGPTVFALTRQNLPAFQVTDVPYSQGVGRGAYIVRKERSKPDYTLIATGSELSLALEVADELEKLQKSVRVVSMPCWELFEQQPADYRSGILGGSIGKRVSIEAGVELGWHKYVGIDGITIAIDTFGASAPAKDLAEHFGFTPQSILERIL